MSNTEERSTYAIVGLSVLTVILLIVALGGIYANRNTVKNIENLMTCPGVPSERCWTGNACMVTDKRKRCPTEDDNDGHSHSHAQGGWHHKKNCNQYYCSEPVRLADGSCCNEDDFCYLDDSKKTCQSGMCVSKNYSLCKGSCNTEEDCETYQIPLSPNFFGERADICYYGTCVTLVSVAFNYPNPLDLLDSNGTNRSTVACVEGVCNLVGDVLVDEFPYQCTFMWMCSKNNPQVVDPGRKRGLETMQLSRLGALHKKANPQAAIAAQVTRQTSRDVN